MIPEVGDHLPKSMLSPYVLVPDQQCLLSGKDLENSYHSLLEQSQYQPCDIDHEELQISSHL
nr:hypothetical protein Iba_scaffold18403CG1000 [Ipomoea batatas]